MKNTSQHQTLTVGELCAAIAEGRLPATLQHNQWYEVNGRELRRFANRRQQPKADAAPRELYPVK
jgi:hypothetical protein